MGEELSNWLDITGAQGDPAKYSKTDLEIWIVGRLFDKFNFKAGKSQRERRRSFEEVWEAASGNPEAVAYGFDAALKAGIYSLAYVNGCIREFLRPKALRNHDHADGNIVPMPLPKSSAPPKPPVRAPRKKKEPVIAEPDEVDCGF